MTTPFQSFQNATLSFKVPSGSPSTDAYGNVTDTLTDWTATAILKQERSPITEAFKASNQQEIYVEGRLIEPQTFPSSLVPEQIGTCTIDGVSYDFRYEPTIASPWYDENTLLGQKVRGYLIQTSLYAA